jgi:2'-5' RNA ligase
MPKFAIYFVPAADDPFYQLGTQILGYDVRNTAPASMRADLQDDFGRFDVKWVSLSRPFGFHVTICDALDCEWAKIALVERELKDLLGCFNPANEFVLFRDQETPIGVWGRSGAYCVTLLYRANAALSMLHALLIGRINPLGTGSDYLRDYLTKRRFSETLHRAQQLRLFASPYVLDNWHPHFTLLNPYTEADSTTMVSRFIRLSASYNRLAISSLCLLVQDHDQANWRIYREFYRC